jgi:hypothetical protein
VRAASADEQLVYEQQRGLGCVTRSVEEFFAELEPAREGLPTFDRLALFKRDYRKLPPEQGRRFRVAVMKLVAALSEDPPRLPGEPLVKLLVRLGRVYELRFDGDGRATFTLTRREGQPHVIWRRIGSHDVLREP